MIGKQVDRDAAELAFRLLFSSIFVVLGGEHLLHDELILQLMPAWIPLKHLASMASGLVLLGGGACIALGIFVDWAGAMLAAFLVTVTLVIHVPGMMSQPATLPAGWDWLWDLYQRSNFIKNVCLLGGCVHFLYHEPGRYSLQALLDARLDAAKRDR